jgi:hypothetical protein
VFFSGLAEVLWASESGGTLKVVWGVLEMACGGLGAACVGRVVFAKRT